VIWIQVEDELPTRPRPPTRVPNGVDPTRNTLERRPPFLGKWSDWERLAAQSNLSTGGCDLFDKSETLGGRKFESPE